MLFCRGADTKRSISAGGFAYVSSANTSLGDQVLTAFCANSETECSSVPAANAVARTTGNRDARARNAGARGATAGTAATRDMTTRDARTRGARTRNPSTRSAPTLEMSRRGVSRSGVSALVLRSGWYMQTPGKVKTAKRTGGGASDRENSPRLGSPRKSTLECSVDHA